LSQGKVHISKYIFSILHQWYRESEDWEKYSIYYIV